MNDSLIKPTYAPPLMSQAGQRLAKRTAPKHAYTDTRIGESELFRANDPLQAAFGGEEAIGHVLHRALDEVIDNFGFDVAETLVGTKPKRQKSFGHDACPPGLMCEPLRNCIRFRRRKCSSR